MKILVSATATSTEQWNDLPGPDRRVGADLSNRHYQKRPRSRGVVDYDGAGVRDDELHQKLNVVTRGMIGLQIHSNDELKLRFKNIRIKPL